MFLYLSYQTHQKYTKNQQKPVPHRQASPAKPREPRKSPILEGIARAERPESGCGVYPHIVDPCGSESMLVFVQRRLYPIHPGLGPCQEPAQSQIPLQISLEDL